MRSVRPVAAAAVLAVTTGLALLGASSAHADTAPTISIAPSTVNAGGVVVVSGTGWGDLTGAPPLASFSVTDQGAGYTITKGTFAATAGPWTQSITIPMYIEPPDPEIHEPGGDYDLCVWLEKAGSRQSGGCATVTVIPAPQRPIPSIPVYRFWSPTFSNAHFFTTNADEVAHVRATDPNWSYEGLAFHAVPLGDKGCSFGSAVYRFYSAVVQEHFYTQDWEEKEHIIATDPTWHYEGVAYCALFHQVDGSVPLYRFWSPGFGKHFFTANQAEADHIRAVDPRWSYEGIAYYVLP
ncbi:hypothetical protein [Cellulomonas sp. URHB0016]